METRTALIAAIASGAAAVLLVGLDLAFNVDVTFEVRSGDTWQTVQSTKDNAYDRGLSCGTDYRLVVHNGMPWSSTVEVTFTRNDGQERTQESWTLSSGETRTSEVFHIDGTRTNGAGRGFYALQVQVGEEFYAYANPCPEAMP